MEMERATSKPNALFAFLTQVGGTAGEGLPLALGFLLGAFAFLFTGFAYQPGNANHVYGDPWALAGFYALMMMILEAAILLDPARRFKPTRLRVATTLGVTIASLAAIGAVHLIGIARIIDWLQSLLPAIQPVLTWLAQNKFATFTAADLVCVFFLWLGVRFATFDPEVATSGGRRIIPGERLAGDLVLSLCCSVLLAWVFFAPFWTTAALAAPSHLDAARKGLTTCDLTYIKAALPCTISAVDWTTIFMLDIVILPLIYLLGALSILGYAAWREALARGRLEEFPTVFRETLRDVITRRITWASLLLALRFVWPLLLIGASVLIVLAAHAEGAYLYTAAVQSNGQILWFDVSFTLLGWEAVAAGTVLLALVMAVGATALQVAPRIRGGVVAQHLAARAHGGPSLRPELAFSLRYVRFLGGLLIQSYWVFSLAFSIVNQLVLIGEHVYENVTHSMPIYWSPFVQPDPLAILSFIVFLYYFRRRTRQRKPAPPAPGS
jgi:hypothetical protein